MPFEAADAPGDSVGGGVEIEAEEVLDKVGHRANAAPADEVSGAKSRRFVGGEILHDRSLVLVGPETGAVIFLGSFLQELLLVASCEPLLDHALRRRPDSPFPILAIFRVVALGVGGKAGN